MYPIAKECPTCGSRRIRVIRSDYRTLVHGKQTLIRDLERQECPVCGEVLFDRSAMKKIESSRAIKKKQPA
jgi:YgiT-type zinc finger domain-containing protein